MTRGGKYIAIYFLMSQICCNFAPRLARGQPLGVLPPFADAENIPVEPGPDNAGVGIPLF